MNKIINPFNNKKYSIYSDEGTKLLKQYLRSFLQIAGGKKRQKLRRNQRRNRGKRKKAKKKQSLPPGVPKLVVNTTSNLLRPMSILKQHHTIDTIQSYINHLIEKIGDNRAYYYHIILLKWLSENTNIDVPSFRKMLRGAYICVRNDNAELFNFICINLDRETSRKSSILNKPKLVTNKGLIPGSSHKSFVKGVSQECKLKLKGNNQIRFGKGVIYDMNKDGSLNEDKGSKKYDLIMGITIDNHTWFQFEKTRTDTFAQKVLHIGDFFQHKATRQNIGPFGNSNYTDKTGKETYYYLKYIPNKIPTRFAHTTNKTLSDPDSFWNPKKKYDSHTALWDDIGPI